MIKTLRLFLIIISFIILDKAQAQDPQFSQYYANPLYLNPGFAGANQEARAGLIYRNQWPSINDANFVTVAAYFDTYFANQRSGVGLLVVRDRAGDLGLTSTSISAQYAYQLPIGEKLTFRPGLQIGYTRQDQDFADLLFASQFDANSGLFDPSLPGEPNFTGSDNVNLLDISLGGVFYTDTWWLGLAGHHLNEPSNSFAGADDVKLESRYSIHGGYKIHLKGSQPYTNPINPSREISVTPTLQYKIQGDFDQMDAGLYFTYHPINFGFWYRGLPFKDVSSQSNNESIIGMLALNTQDGLTIGYSYDVTISDLGTSSGGAHEVTLTYNFILRNRRIPPKDERFIPCPKI